MRVEDLNFEYPEHLVATQPTYPSRVMWVENDIPTEQTFDELISKFDSGDLLVLNDTKVIPVRITGLEGIEFTFIKELQQNCWEVLFPASSHDLGEKFLLPDTLSAELKSKGRPQVIQLSRQIDQSYFEKWGQMPLPPYIEKARRQGGSQKELTSSDRHWYQSNWAENHGSLAAPTASLHFTTEHLDTLQKRGVNLAKLTLHVGLGTFLPVRCENLENHKMHSEKVFIPHSTADQVEKAHSYGHRVWALGTTVARALESFARGDLTNTNDGWLGQTDLLIQPGFEFKVINGLITNFHQPCSTLMALVAAFAGLDVTRACYQWAIDRNFRLFSYGDLSVWKK